MPNHLKEARHAAPRQSERHDAAAKSGKDSRPTCDFTKVQREYTPQQLENARRRMQQFSRWRELNPQAYGFLEYLAMELFEGKQRIGAKRLIEAVRSRDFTSVDGRPTTTNNDFGPIIARVLISERPELEGHIETRASVFDVLLDGDVLLEE